MKYGLSPRTLQKIHDVFRRYPEVDTAVLYGSRAKGTYKNGSDIDLTLYGTPALTHRVVARIATDLDEQLLPYTIDLSIFRNLSNPAMTQQIQRDGVALYKKGS